MSIVYISNKCFVVALIFLIMYVKNKNLNIVYHTNCYVLVENIMSLYVVSILMI